MEQIVVSVGPLSSFNSLVYRLAPKFKEIRYAYSVGKTPSILFDFTHISQNSNIGIGALSALVSSSKKLKDYIGHPIPAHMPWNPIVQSFLADIGFFELVNRFSIYEFVGPPVGGYQTNAINPYNRIIYFGDVLKIREKSAEEIATIKAHHKQKISPNLQFRFSKILEGLNYQFQTILLNTTLEMIVNSLVHGEDYAFVGIQKTSKRITVSVCDSGIGFAKSLQKTFPQKFSNRSLSHIEAILIGSLIQKQEHGLRLAISEVLNYSENDLFSEDNEGWVTISSYDSELRWQKKNWGRALNYTNQIEKNPTSINVNAMLGEPLSEFVEKERIHQGYWKQFESYLIGTRITFEIPLVNK